MDTRTFAQALLNRLKLVQKNLQPVDGNMDHRGTTVVTVVTAFLIVLAFALMSDLPEKNYYLLKYLIAVGLIATSGFFVQPRKRMFLQNLNDDAEEAPEIEWQEYKHIRKKISSKYGWVPDGWTEIDFFEKTAYAAENGQVVEVSYKDLEPRIKAAQINHQAISTNLATIHLLAALFFTPIFGITMRKNIWMVYDFYLAVYLICSLVRIQRERHNPRFSLITRKTEGKPLIDFTINDEKNELVRIWPSALVLIVASAAFGVAGSKVFWNPYDSATGFVETSLMMVGGTGMLVYILVGAQVVLWGRSMPVRNWILVGFVTFLAVCSAVRRDSYSDRHSRTYDEYADPYDPYE